MLPSISRPLFLIFSSLRTLLTANFSLESALHKLHRHGSLAHDRILYMVYKNTHILTQLKFSLSLLRLMPSTAFYVIQIFQIKPNSSNLPQKSFFFFRKMSKLRLQPFTLQLFHLSFSGNLQLESPFLIW